MGFPPDWTTATGPGGVQRTRQLLERCDQLGIAHGRRAQVASQRAADEVRIRCDAHRLAGEIGHGRARQHDRPWLVFT
ncbi:MAG: hypothetical protein M0014_03915 [Actinomycetota bacterium]|nr:hypothetical protein [Actinomycetota bacterium]